MAHLGVTKRSVGLWLQAGLLGVTSLVACDKLKGAAGSTDPTATAAPPAPEQPAAPQANEVIRYSTMEVAESGNVTIRQPVRARKAADRSSDVVDTLQAGASVSRVARYGGFNLVTWNNGANQGWVETQVAFAFNSIPFDAGVFDAGFKGLGGLDSGTTPTSTAPPPPPPPPPATTTTPPPPPPPPPARDGGVKPPPPPTKDGGLKPPKLGN